MQDFQTVSGSRVPEYSADLLSLDITATSPSPGRPLQPPPPPRRPAPPGGPPFDTPASLAAPGFQTTIPPPPPPPGRRDTANQDIVLVAAAVAGGVGLLLLGLIAVYCGFMRHYSTDLDTEKLVRRDPVLHPHNSSPPTTNYCPTCHRHG